MENTNRRFYVGHSIHMKWIHKWKQIVGNVEWIYQFIHNHNSNDNNNKDCVLYYWVLILVGSVITMRMYQWNNRFCGVVSFHWFTQSMCLPSLLRFYDSSCTGISLDWISCWMMDTCCGISSSIWFLMLSRYHLSWSPWMDNTE